MVKKNLLCIILAVLSVSLKAQQTNENRLSIDYSFSQHQHLVNLTDNGNVKYTNQNAICISYGRLTSDNLEAGVYCGILFAEYHVSDDPNTLTDRLVFSPGVSLSYHLLPKMNIPSEHIDITLDNIVGGTFAKGCKLEYGIGLGIHYYPFNHFGINASALLGNFTIARLGATSTSNFQLKTGLSWRW